MQYGVLTEIVGNYIVRLFEHHHDPALYFHNLTHTQTVVSRVQEISAYYNLSEHELFIVTTAAWFHDAGYLLGGQPGHEPLGADMARVFLRDQGISFEAIGSIEKCILATSLPQHPEGLLEQIVCDADLFHFGTAELFTRDKLMRKEVETKICCVLDEAKWLSGTIKLLESHHYHTSYCQTNLNDQKQINLQILKTRLGEHS